LAEACDRPGSAEQEAEAISVGLSAVVVAVTDDEPRVLVVQPDEGMPDGLPAGPLQPRHRTLEAGLRAWVEQQTAQALGYVEQLYTFGDLNRYGRGPGAGRTLSIGYLALVREARPAHGAIWQGWYRYFPWEDWRAGRPAILEPIERHLRAWTADAADAAERRRRAERLGVTFGLGGAAWNDERVLERYELLYELSLVPEAHRDGVATWAARAAAIAAAPMMLADHRRILATAIARLRGKIKYRPVVFELMPPSFTFLQLQRTVEALAGVGLHKPNFRRLVEHQGVVEETGEVSAETGGRPARRLRFRREVLLERPAPGLKLPHARRSG
jgi:hypothetical protein